MTEAISPTPMAMQSKAMWIARPPCQREPICSSINTPLTIRYQSETVSPDTVEHLHSHVAHVEHEKVEDLSRLWILEDGLQVSASKVRY